MTIIKSAGALLIMMLFFSLPPMGHVGVDETGAEDTGALAQDSSLQLNTIPSNLEMTSPVNKDDAVIGVDQTEESDVVHEVASQHEIVHETSQSHRDYLKQRAEEEGFPFALLDRIVKCESGWRMVKNPISSAYGYFQIIDGTERTTPQYKAGQRKYDPYVNMEMGLWLYKTRGANPWYPSEHCWGSN